MRFSSRFLSIFCLAVLFVSLLTACLPPALPPVLKIGMVAPFEGRYRSMGYDAIYAARLAVREINAAGGVNGWRLELVAYDDRGDAALAQTAARNLAVDADVVAVIGHYRQESTAAAQPVYAEAALPLLAINGWVTSTTAPVWSLAPSPATFSDALLATVPETATAAVWGEGVLAVSTYEALAAGRDRIVSRGHAGLSLDENGLQPAFVFSSLAPQVAGDALAIWRDLGWQGSLMGGPSLATTEFADVAGEAAEGACFTTPYPFPQDLEAGEDWTAAYQAVGPHVPFPGPYALPTYEAIYLLAAAVAEDSTAHSAPTRAGIALALSSPGRDGVLGPIRWDAEGFWATASLYTYCWEEGIPKLSVRISPD